MLVPQTVAGPVTTPAMTLTPRHTNLCSLYFVDVIISCEATERCADSIFRPRLFLTCSRVDKASGEDIRLMSCHKSPSVGAEELVGRLSVSVPPGLKLVIKVGSVYKR